MNWVNVGIIFLGLLISPLLGFVIAYLAQGAIDKLMKRYTKGLTQIESAEKILQPFVLIFAGLNAISRSGNDSGKVLGVVYTLLNGNQSLSTDSIYIILIVGGFYAVGQFIVGRRLMVSVGSSTGGQFVQVKLLLLRFLFRLFYSQPQSSVCLFRERKCWFLP